MNTVLTIILTSLIATLAAGGIYFISLKEYDPHGPIQRFTVGDGTKLRVGILSDSQLNCYIFNKEFFFI